MANYLHVIFFSLIGGVFSLIGGVLLLSRKSSTEALAKYATPFAAGALLAAAFFDLLPEALHQIPIESAMKFVLGGVVLFFLVEHFLHWFHHHHDDHQNETTPAPLVIVGDTVHNLLDGIAIGAAFLIDVPTGIVTAIAVSAHEIPQEIGDFGLLLRFGYSRRKTLIINVVTALASTFGAVMTFWLGSRFDLPIGILLAITAGMFIYIASSDLIPLVHEQSKKKTAGHMAVGLFLLGILIVWGAANLAHNYIDTEHSSSDHSLQAPHDHDDQDDHH